MDRGVSYCYLGIDPGKSGGIALLARDEEVLTWKMPSSDKDLWEIIEALPLHTKGMLELVHSSPQMGVKSSFTFGQGFGKLQMALTAAEVSFEEVRPQAWIKGLSIPSKHKIEKPSVWKNRLREKAQKLYPRITVTLAIADALLIATFCKRSYLSK